MFDKYIRFLTDLHHCVYHRLVKKKSLTLQELYGENLMLIHQGWSNYADQLRDELWEKHTKINIVDFDFYRNNFFCSFS